MRRDAVTHRLPWLVAVLSLVALGLAAVVGLTTEPSPGVPRLTASDGGWWIAYLTFIVLGALVCTRRPENLVGRLMITAGAFNAFSQATLQYAVWGLLRHPGSLPGADIAAWMCTFLWAPSIAVVASVVLFFPTGSLVSRRWRWLPALLAGAIVAICVSAAVDLWSLRGRYLLTHEDVVTRHRFSGLVVALGWPVVLGCVVVGMASIVVRYRRAHGIERQQLKWLAVAAMVTAPAIIVGQPQVLPKSSPLWAPMQVLNSPAWFAIAVALAVLRYRLYDIDRIISRTVSYAILTAALVGLYVGGVAFATQLLPFSSSFAVAASTLLVAALFQPVRRRVQSAVDRRFNRAGYDAARTVETFSARLRTAVDLRVVADDLVGVAVRAVEPETISLWTVGS